jgi:hypothetical protein
MCNEAAGYRSAERPDIALLDDGRIVLATSEGLKISSDAGCSWQPVAPLGAIATPAMAQHPSESSTLYIATFGASGSGLQITRDAGASFAPLLKLPDNDFVQEILVAPSDPALLYVSGELFDKTGTLTHYVARSPDAGKTWTRTAIAVLEAESDLALLDVDPGAPQRLVAKTVARDRALTSERLLISDDEGRSFRQVLESDVIHAAAFAAGGTMLWVGTESGLLRSDDGGGHFETIEGPQRLLSCVTEREGVVWACGYFGPGSDGLATSSDGGQAFATRMDFAAVMSPVSCDPGSPTATRCAPLWADWQREILTPAAQDEMDTKLAGGVSRVPELPRTDGAAAGGSAAVGGVPRSDPLARAEPTTACALGVGGATRRDGAVLGYVALALYSLALYRRLLRAGGRRGPTVGKNADFKRVSRGR